MKNLKIILLPLAVYLLPTQLFAQQHPLQEALALRPYFQLSSSGQQVVLKEAETVQPTLIFTGTDSVMTNVMLEDVREILAPYTGGFGKVDQFNVNTAFDNGNPYMIVEYTSNFGLKALKFEPQNTETAPQGGNAVSSIADGIARFLVKRTKEELTLAFFADFKRKIEEDDLYFKRFFDNTKQVLLVVDEDVYQFQIYLEAIREAFITDLRVLPGNLSDYLRDCPAKQLKPAHQAISVDFFSIVQMSLDGEPTLNMMRLLGSDSLSEIQLKVGGEPELKNLSAGLHLVNHISESLFNPATGSLTSKEIKAALADPITLRLYLGLLWHNSLNIKAKFKNDARINSLIAKAATSSALLSDWQQILAGFGQNAEEMEQSLQKRADKNVALSESFSRHLQIFTKILQTANTLNTLLNPDAGEAIEGKYLQLIQQIGSLHFNIRQNHYSAAVGNTVFILDILAGKDFVGRKDFVKYGMFIAAVADAEDPAEVQNALELFALPAGSSKAKKGDGRFSVALNAYTGFSGSAERFRDSNISEGVVSVAAPLGVSVNWGKTWGKNNKDGCIGFFFPVIDVGAVMAYRFKKDGIDNLPPMEWKNILAPGVYLVVDPPAGKWPLSLGVGGQLGPLLRKVERGGTYRNENMGGYRIGGFITIDIPVNYLRLKSGESN